MFTNHLDIIPYPPVALFGMIVTLLDSSVSFFIDGVPMFVLPHKLTNENITCISFFKCCKRICLSVNNKMIVIFLLVMRNTKQIETNKHKL